VPYIKFTGSFAFSLFLCFSSAMPYAEHHALVYMKEPGASKVSTVL